MTSGSAFTYSILCVLAGGLLAVLYVALPFVQAFFVLPAINDITTDFEAPPAFLAIEAPPYPAGFISTQREAYTDLETAEFAAPPDVLFERALNAALDLGWRIVANSPPGPGSDGRLEAVATTKFMRFKDDVVVRLRSDGTGTLIDLRSRSRIGTHDLGTNAARIRTFLERLQR